MAKPFLKWAGGKGKIIKKLIARLPKIPDTGYNYFEPFLGGGALFFDLQKKGKIKSAFLSDINPELILCYLTIRDNVDSVIKDLEIIERRFPKRDKTRKKFYYSIREKWNSKICLDATNISKYQASKRTAMTIFLNKTCFNGLFRVNSKAEFNTPYGYYKKPSFVNKENLINVSKALKNVNISCHKFEDILLEENDDNFVYFDPPYRPLTSSSSFTAYSKSGFNDKNQKELAEFTQQISEQTKFMLSNSDPKNEDSGDLFFDELYSQFKIDRIKAPRYINSDGDGRGEVSEIIVVNY